MRAEYVYGVRVYRSLERKNEPEPNPPRYKLDLQSLTPKKAGILFKIQAEVRLIQCLLVSNKRLKEDFLIFSGRWHDG